jgi:hypothetical protein
MSWTIPPADGVDYRSWDFVKQFYLARRERAAAAEQARWPRTHNVWDSGIISGISSTSVTIDGKVWDTNRWAGFSDPDLFYAPADYDLIIDSACPPDPRTVIHAQISSNTADTLTVADMTQNVTEGRCISLASLVSRRAYIIKRNGLWWSDRWIEFPNDNVLAHGRVSSAVNGSIVATSILPANGVSLVGKDVLFWNATPTLQRGSVSSLTGSTLAFTGTTGAAVVDAEFVVVASGGYFRWPAPGAPPRPGSIRADYRGMMESYNSHDASDTLSAMDKPRVTFQSFEGHGSLSCPVDPTTVTVIDKDYWTDVNEACDDPDHAYAPDINKTLRHLWVSMADDVHYFAEPIDYDNAESIPYFAIATWLNSAGINAQSVTGGTVTGGGAIPFSISAPYTPIDIFYAVLGSDGDVIAQGETTYTGSGDEIAGGFTSPDNDGASIRVSLGPTRYVRRTFQRMYSKTVFIPAISDSAIVWPPTEDDPGSYVTRAASTHYLATDSNGFVGESSLAADAFSSGDLARFVGDNMCDPAIEPHTPTGDTEPRIGNYERFFTGTRSAAYRASLSALRSGTATAGTTQQLTNSDINWWGGDFYGNGNVFTRTGTATGGSTTTLEDAGQSGSAFWDDALRSQVGLVVTVTLSGVEHKRLITSHSGTTIGFAEALPATASGADYVIRETDAETNRYRSRTLTLAKPDPDHPGAILSDTATILGNDDTTLFFAEVSFAVDETTTYSITADPRCNGAWKWDGAAWIVPTGTDARVGVEFSSDQRKILPTCVVRYGWPRLGDYMVMLNWSQIYAAYNKLIWTLKPTSWTSRANPSTPEYNNAGGGDSMQGSLADDKLNAHNNYTVGLVPDLAIPPTANARLSFSDGGATMGGSDDAEHSRAYGYMLTSVTAADCPLSYTLDWFTYGWIDSADHSGTINFGVGNITSYSFDANGDQVSFHRWRKFTSSATGSYESKRSDKFGSLDEPNWGPDPADPPQNTVNGYYVAKQAAIYKWAMTYA